MQRKIDWSKANIQPPNYDPCPVVRNTYDLTTATGDELDRIASMYGLKRQDAIQPDSMGYNGQFAETDESLRYRVREYALGNSGGYWDPRQIGEEFADYRSKKSEPICECGAAKASGINGRGQGHSSWCPLR